MPYQLDQYFRNDDSPTMSSSFKNQEHNRSKRAPISPLAGRSHRNLVKGGYRNRRGSSNGQQNKVKNAPKSSKKNVIANNAMNVNKNRKSQNKNNRKAPVQNKNKTVKNTQRKQFKKTKKAVKFPQVNPGPDSRLIQFLKQDDKELMNHVLSGKYKRGRQMKQNINHTGRLGTTALMEVVRRGCYSWTHTKCIIDMGAKVGIKDERGNTALHIAAKTGSDQKLHLLLKNGANPNARNFDGYSPFHYACMTGNWKMVEMLREAGSHINMYTRFRYTALHYACEKKDYKLVYMLLEWGARHICVNKFKNTPLMRAIHFGDKACIKHLMDKMRYFKRDDILGCSQTQETLDYVCLQLKIKFYPEFGRFVSDRVPGVYKNARVRFEWTPRVLNKKKDKQDQNIYECFMQKWEKADRLADQKSNQKFNKKRNNGRGQKSKGNNENRKRYWRRQYN